MDKTKNSDELKLSVKFDPASLSQEDLEAAVEHYLGLHPKYFVYKSTEVGPCIIADVYRLALDGYSFTLFKEQAKEFGIEV